MISSLIAILPTDKLLIFIWGVINMGVESVRAHCLWVIIELVNCFLPAYVQRLEYVVILRRTHDKSPCKDIFEPSLDMETYVVDTGKT